MSLSTAYSHWTTIHTHQFNRLRLRLLARGSKKHPRVSEVKREDRQSDHPAVQHVEIHFGVKDTAGPAAGELDYAVDRSAMQCRCVDQY